MKEIVITNPNGVTLHTKKSLVNDDIKIKLDDSIKAIDGVELIAGPYGDKDLMIDGTKDFSGIVVDGYNGELLVNNTFDINQRTNINIAGFVNVNINDIHDYNLITADNLTPENIKSGVDILGVTGTFEGGTPIELATIEEMEAVLVADNIGKIYKYVGETNETFTNGNLYQVMEVE